MVQYIKNNEEHHFHRKFTGPGRSVAHSTLCDSCKKHSVGPQDSVEAVSHGLYHRIWCSQQATSDSHQRQTAGSISVVSTKHSWALLPAPHPHYCFLLAFCMSQRREGLWSTYSRYNFRHNPALPEGWTQNKSPNHDQKVSMTAGIKQNIKLSIF